MSNLTKAQLEQQLEQLQAQLATQQQQQASGLMIKKNASGGVYIRSAQFKEWSVKKSKQYTYGLNIPFATAKILFNDSEMLNQIKEAINSMSN